MDVRIETITPAKAKEYLSHNMVNRLLNKARVDAYARTMKSGNWQLNGEAIRFNKNGELIDGQHRLNAIIKAGIPVSIVIMTDIDNAVSIYDRGRNRSVSDALIIEGMDKRLANNTFVSAAKLHYIVHGTTRNITDDEVRKFLFENEEALASITDLIPSTSHTRCKASPRTAPYMLAMFYAYLCGEDGNKLHRFTEVYVSGFYNTPEELAAIVCRNDTISGIIEYTGLDNRIKALYKFEKAINDFCNGYPRKISYNSWDKPVYSCNPIFNIK